MGSCSTTSSSSSSVKLEFCACGGGSVRPEPWARGGSRDRLLSAPGGGGATPLPSAATAAAAARPPSGGAALIGCSAAAARTPGVAPGAPTGCCKVAGLWPAGGGGPAGLWWPRAVLAWAPEGGGCCQPAPSSCCRAFAVPQLRPPCTGWPGLLKERLCAVCVAGVTAIGPNPALSAPLPMQAAPLPQPGPLQPQPHACGNPRIARGSLGALNLQPPPYPPPPPAAARRSTDAFGPSTQHYPRHGCVPQHARFWQACKRSDRVSQNRACRPADCRLASDGRLQGTGRRAWAACSMDNLASPGCSSRLSSPWAPHRHHLPPPPQPLLCLLSPPRAHRWPHTHSAEH